MKLLEKDESENYITTITKNIEYDFGRKKVPKRWIFSDPIVLQNIMTEERTELQDFLKIPFIAPGRCKPCMKFKHIFVQILWVYPLLTIGLIVLFTIPFFGLLLLPIAISLGYFSKYYHRHKKSMYLFEEEARIRNIILHKIQITNTDSSLSSVTTYVA